MGRKRKNDGLTKTQRYRLKDVDAYRAKKREYARTSIEREKRKLYMRTWRENNREKHNAWSRRYASEHREQCRLSSRVGHYRSKYGITIEQRDAMVKAQHGRCTICCKKFESSRTTHIDHCHETKAIRGILCHVCNTKLGWYERHSAAISAYLGEEP